MKLRLPFGSRRSSDKFAVSSLEKDKPSVHGDHPTGGGGLTTVRDLDRKEEIFFDSRPWLNSDSEDDFSSVNGEFTPSRGSTPLHPSSHFHGKTLGLNSEQSPLDMKKLFELFRDSVRSDHHHHHHHHHEEEDSDDEENRSSVPNGGGSAEGDFKSPEKPLKCVQCCIPRMPIGQSSFIKGKKKKLNPPPASPWNVAPGERIHRSIKNRPLEITRKRTSELTRCVLYL